MSLFLKRSAKIFKGKETFLQLPYKLVCTCVYMRVYAGGEWREKKRDRDKERERENDKADVVEH